MKKFKFTLHALLHLKESLEKQERNNLGAATRRLNELMGERDDMLARRESAQQEYGEKLVSGMRALETQQFTAYFRMMKDMLEEQERRIAEAQAEVEACRKRLVEVLREIRMLENLKDKQYQEYLQEAQVEQDKLIGDFVSFQSKTKTGE